MALHDAELEVTLLDGRLERLAPLVGHLQMIVQHLQLVPRQLQLQGQLGARRVLPYCDEPLAARAAAP